MNYSCLSCRARYSIPDRRVAAAGADGLRVRCSRCRSIMAVHASEAIVGVAGVDDGVMSMATGIIANPFAAVGLDGAIGGVDAVRDVTGVFTPMLTGIGDAPDNSPEERSQRLFFAAIGGRSRGPFTAREMATLADKGKVRAGTLVWRSGAPSWQPLRAVTAFDAGWLQDAVKRRKRREAEAETATLTRAGITPILLEHRAIRAVSSSTGAPDLPHDAIAELDDDDVIPLEAPPRRWPGRLIAAAVIILLAGVVAAASTWMP